MRDAHFQDGTLTYTGAAPTDRADRWTIAFTLFCLGEEIAKTALTVTVDDEATADALGERCLAYYAQTGKLLNLPEQKDPRPSSLESIKALRTHTGKGLHQCYQAYARRDEPAFGGDPVLALATLITEERAIRDADGHWSRTLAQSLRERAPALDTLFPLAA